MFKKYLLILIMLSFFILPVVSATCETIIDTYYVNDNGSTGCPGYNYSTINNAILAHPSCARIFICDGTYNEDVSLGISNSSLILEGEAEGEVTINGISNSSVVNMHNTEDIYLKNLVLNSTKNYGIGVNLSDDVVIENIELSMSNNSYATGIYVYGSNNLEFKGNILIDGVESTNTNYDVKGVGFSQSSATINTDSFEIRNISGASTKFEGFTSGLYVNDSDLEINSGLKIWSLLSNNSLVHGIYIEQNSNVNFNSDLNIGIIMSPKIKSIKISSSEVNFTGPVSITTLMCTSSVNMGVEISSDSDV